MQHSRWSKLWFCALLGAASSWAANQDGAGLTVNPVPAYPTYRIGPGDVLQIDVWKEPDASMAAVTVRPDGMISLAMIGETPAADRTPAELETALAEKYGELIRDPRVTVTVREVTSQRVYLIGEVRREGPVRMVGRLTVLQALAEAGGITDYAKRNRIYILRTSNGRQVKLPFNYGEVVRGQKVEQNVQLFPGDTIVVPR
jgi:polysaccharide export outer membrane protein